MSRFRWPSIYSSMSLRQQSDQFPSVVSRQSVILGGVTLTGAIMVRQNWWFSEKCITLLVQNIFFSNCVNVIYS